MTTITTGTQGPQIRLIVLIGIALAAISVAAMIAVNRPTTTTEATQDASSESQAITNAGATDRVGALPDSIADAQDRAMAQERIADREAAALAYGGPVADAVLGDTTGATDRVAPLPDSIADAQDRMMAQVRIDDREAAAQTYGAPVADAVPGTTAGATDRVAPLPDSIADAQDRVMAQVRIDDRETAAQTYGGPVADAVLGDATAPSDTLLDGVTRQAAANEQAISNGATPGLINTSAVDPLEEGITRRAAAYEQAINDGGIPGFVAPAGAAPSPDVSTNVNPADIKFLNGTPVGASDEPVRWDDNPADIKFLNGYLDDSSRADPVKDWQWPMPNEQIL